MSAHVLVVGAGLSGLSAAWRLQCAGLRVSVVEAGGRVGGSAGGGAIEGIAFEPAAAVVPASAPALSGLARELGLGSALRRRPLGPTELVVGGRRRTPRLRAPAGPASALRTRRLRMLLRWFGELLDPAAPERGVRLDDRSVADFCALYLGRRRLSQAYAPLFEAELGLEADETSRLLLLLLMTPLGDVALERVTGLSALAEELGKRLVAVRTGARATALRPDARGVSLADGEELRADAVVLAVPAPEVLSLGARLWPAERVCLERAGYADRLRMAVALRDRVVPRAQWLGRSEGGPLAGVADLTPDGDADGSLLLLSARPDAADRLAGRSDAECGDALLAAAERVRPGLRGRVAARRVCRLPRSLPRFDVGHYRRVLRLRREQARHFADRPLVFGGSYTVAPHAEGALAAGLRAAADVLASLEETAP